MEIQIFTNRTKGVICGHRLNVTTNALYYEDFGYFSVLSC